MELSSEDFKNSLVILDDVDCIREKKLKNKIKDILDKVLMTGRHFSTSCIYLSHLTTAGADTKMILAECHSITCVLDDDVRGSFHNIIGFQLILDIKVGKNLKTLFLCAIFY